MKNISLLAVILFINSSFIEKNINISTNEALSRYKKILKNHTFLLFPEYRENPIRWFDSIPESRLKEGFLTRRFNMSARPGDYYVYQVGFWALKPCITDIQVDFSDLKSREGKIIPAGNMNCFNKGGIDFRGSPFIKTISVPEGRAQALWMGIDIGNVPPGIYLGAVTITAGNQTQVLDLQLNVSGDVVPDHGNNEAKTLSRLAWINSTTGIDDSVTKGYIPIRLEDRRISILGRCVHLSANGLPDSVISYFHSSNTAITGEGESIVKNPFRFVIEKEDKRNINLTPGNLKVVSLTPSTIVWKVMNTSEEIDLECTGQMDFDGFIDYKLKLIAKKTLQISDIRLEIPVDERKSEYMMGLGHEGGYRYPEWKWKWDITKNQDMLWIGSVSGGLRIKWKDENYVRPLINIYYSYGPLKMPDTWCNGNKGGVDIEKQADDVIINAYSGSREMKEGDQLNYDFELLITPFKTINPKEKFGERYYHGNGGPAGAKEEGADIMNIHHATEFYPFINYPYLDETKSDLLQLVSEAHKENIRIKFYYTTREITKNLPEFWAFNSLNGEVIFPGPGNSCRTVVNPNGPDEWLVKNLRENYIPAWCNFIDKGRFKGVTDLAVITTPDSRLNNFYAAGLEWMVKNLGIDGIYIDDSALDRITLRRSRKIIDRYRENGKIDFHSWNHFRKSAGFTNCLNLYMDLLPYIDLVWIGEGRDYDRMPDHWLIEVSGIPFGLTGQMLEGGGNPWRGMVYGITTRAGYGNNSPTSIWKFWDEHNISDNTMTGYWEKECPLKCYNPMVKATVYKGKDELIIAVANWNKSDQPVRIESDPGILGFDLSQCSISIPDIPSYQTQQDSVSLDNLIIPGGKGYLIVVKPLK